MSSLKDWYRYVDSKARSRGGSTPGEEENPADERPAPSSRAEEGAAAPPGGIAAPSSAPGAGSPAAEDEDLDVWSGLFPQRRKPDSKPAAAPPERPDVPLNQAPTDRPSPPIAGDPSPAPPFPRPEPLVEIPRFEAFVSTFATEPPSASGAAGEGPGRETESRTAPASTAAPSPVAPPYPPGSAPASRNESGPAPAQSVAANANRDNEPEHAPRFSGAIGEEALPAAASPIDPARTPVSGSPSEEAAMPSPEAAAPVPVSSASAALDLTSPEPAPAEAGAPTRETAAVEPEDAADPSLPALDPDEDAVPWRSPFELPGPGRTISSGASSQRPEAVPPRGVAASPPTGSQWTGNRMVAASEERPIRDDPPVTGAERRPAPGTEAWERERVERLARTFRETLRVLEESVSAPPPERRRPAPLETFYPPAAAPAPVEPPAAAAPAAPEAPPVPAETYPPAPAPPVPEQATFEARPSAPAPTAFERPDTVDAEPVGAAAAGPLADLLPAVRPEAAPVPTLPGVAIAAQETISPPAAEPAPEALPSGGMAAPPVTFVAPAEPSVAQDGWRTNADTAPSAAAPPAVAVRSDVLRSIEEASLIRQRLPQHMDMLLRIPTNEVAQNSYKSPFRESREELIRRLLDPQLTLEEAARMLGVCPTTVRRYTNRGMLRCHRTPGNQRRFRMSDVLLFLEQFGDRIDRAAEAKRFEEAA